MVNDGKDDISIYKIETKQKIDKKKVLLVILILLSIICIMLIWRNINNTMISYKVYKKYENQILSLNNQELEKKQQKKAEAEKIRQDKLPKLTEIGKQNIEKIYKSEQKRAFLTFDDGPSSLTQQILDTLKQENVKATFFVLGTKVAQNPEIVKRIYDEGHYIANHGYSHVYSQIYSTPENVLNEYNQCNEEIKKALGEPEYNSHLFRFPGGLAGGKYAQIKEQAGEILKQNNIAYVDWNALNGDAERNNLTPEFEISRLNETTENKNSIVVLMHDSPAKKVTADILQQIIQNLREKGYEFENFYEIIK